MHIGTWTVDYINAPSDFIRVEKSETWLDLMGEPRYENPYVEVSPEFVRVAWNNKSVRYIPMNVLAKLEYSAAPRN